MANTVIQIKRSSATATPTNGSLAAAEPAYSFNSDKLFLGNTNGTGVVEVGGKYWVDTTQAAFAQANAAYNAANNGSSVTAAFSQANTARDHANSAFAQANAAPGIANSYATAVGTAGNSYTQTVGTAGNNYTITVGAAANGWANTISSERSAAANGWANTISLERASASNGWANTISSTRAAAANGWANTVGADAKGYANSTFLKLTATSQTITGDLAVVGNLTLSGNTVFSNVSTLSISDPLIYLASNNYLSDLVDIGFIANYVNATGQNVHTGLYREHENKEYYLFQGYDKEPVDNHIGAFSNNMTLAILNADLKTSNLWLGGANAILTIGAAFDKANAANLLAFNTGAGANAYAQAVGTAGNNYTITVGAAANGWANTISSERSAASNGWANTISSTRAAASNAYAQEVGTAGNNYTITVGAAANGWANTISSTRAAASNAYAETIGAAANTNAANASYLSTGTVPSARISGAYTGITGVGTLTQGTWNANVITVPYGGTGETTFTQNGVLYGNTAGALKVTGAGTEGQVLQASATGVPGFGMLDGGVF